MGHPPPIRRQQQGLDLGVGLVSQQLVAGRQLLGAQLLALG
jgi:hypothetical protein